MRLIARFVPVSLVAALALSCEVQKASAPLPTVALERRAPEHNPDCPVSGRRARKTPVELICVVTVPGNPIISGTKSWVDPRTERYYLTDVSNAGVDIIDAESFLFLGRINGFVGATGVAATSGPNSIVFTGRGQAWVSDGNSNVKVIDVNSMQIIRSISTAIPACDDGTAHFCQRTNEITYDPEHKLILVQNPSPLAVGGAHDAIDTYATFISAVPPYDVRGTISFPNRRGQEAPLWDQRIHRILTAVSGRLVGTTVYQQYVAVINPAVRPYTVEAQYDIDCTALGITGAGGARLFGINDPALGPLQHMVIPACGRPIIMDASTGAFINTGITQVAGGNETWYNSGDKRFYVAAADGVTGVAALGVIDARTATWLQNVSVPQGTNPAAHAENNHMFVVVQVTAAQVAAPTTDNSACSNFGFKGKGCVAIFRHMPTADQDGDDGDDGGDDEGDHGGR